MNFIMKVCLIIVTTIICIMANRAWCFTLNNYMDADLALLASAALTYVCYGKEVGENGTPHLQGYIYNDVKKSLKALKSLLPRAHWEVAKGTTEQNITYCSKQGDFTEHGKKPLTSKERGKLGGDKRALQIEAQWELAKTGKFELLPPAQIKTWEYIHQKYRPAPLPRDVLKNLWIQGPSGCGKSSWIRSQEIPFYNKPMSKWWDGYQNEDMVVLDDFDPSHGKFLGYFLKIWADHYPFNAEVKGGMFHIRPGIVCITSQFAIEDCFDEHETVAAVKRRFRVVDMSLEMSKHLRIVNMFE